MKDWLKLRVRALWLARLLVHKTSRFCDLVSILRGPDVSYRPPDDKYAVGERLKRIFTNRVRGILLQGMPPGFTITYVLRSDPALSIWDIRGALHDLEHLREAGAATHFMSHVEPGLKVLARLPLLTSGEKEEINQLCGLGLIFSRFRCHPLPEEADGWYARYLWKKTTPIARVENEGCIEEEE